MRGPPCLQQYQQLTNPHHLQVQAKSLAGARVGIKPLLSVLSLKFLRPPNIKTHETLANLTLGKGTWATATHTAGRNPVWGHLYCQAFTVEWLWDHTDCWVCNLLGKDLGLTGELTKKPLVWKVHLLLLFLLRRLSRASHTTSPSALGTVHSLQVRRERSQL